MYSLQPEKKSSGCRNVLAAIGVIALVLVGLVIFVVFIASSAINSANTASSTHRVVYKISTSRDSSVWPSCYGFDVTYEMPSGTSQKRANICDGAKTTEVDQFVGSSGDFVYLSVQNDEKLAKISCQIHIDGKLVHQTYSEGQHVIASCSGSIP